MSESSSRRGFLREIAAAAARVAVSATEEEAAPPPVAPHAPLLSEDEIERYSRQLLLPEWTELAQVALRDASVLVIGAGALGSPVALYLAGAGVGRLGIADSDIVEVSNLHRQHVHFSPDIGVPKVESAAAKLRFLNPDVLVEPYQVRLDAENAPGLVEGQDLVVDCSDSFATRYAVNAACCAAGINLVEGGAVGWHGMVMGIRPGISPYYRCAFAVEPSDAPSCASAGIVGPAAGVVGSLQALEALKFLTGAAQPLTDAFVTVDLATLEVLRVTTHRREDCPDCG